MYLLQEERIELGAKATFILSWPSSIVWASSIDALVHFILTGDSI